MNQILWGTDIHYNFVSKKTLKQLHHKIKRELESQPDTTLAVVLTGDISESHLLEEHLSLIRKGFGLPVYFVCGNHDYWHSSFATLRQRLAALTNESDVKWLGALPFVAFSEKTALVGHDGWYDAECGDWENSQFMMNDWIYTSDFRGLSRAEIVSLCRKLAKEAADHVKNGFRAAVEAGHKHIIVATHVPPFQECSVYQNQPSSLTTVCWFSSLTMGDALYELAAENPDVEVEVFCGHTHGGCQRKILPNLVVTVGSAEYNYPQFHVIGLPEQGASLL